MKDWRSARVLITGARGFIGTHLCRRLVGTGAAVRGISTKADTSTLEGITWSRVDLTDSGAVRTLVESVAPDVIFHLAGHVTGSSRLDEVEPTMRGNLLSTVNLLLAATRARSPHIVVAGSMREPTADDPDLSFGSPYAASKWASSGYVRLFHELYRLPVITTRLMMVYGPGQWDATKVVPYVVTSLLEGRSPALSSGAAEADWVFVDDVVAGLLAAAPAADGQEVEIGTGRLTTVRAVVERIASLIPRAEPVRFGVLPDRPFERVRAARTKEAERLLGWSARTGLDEGLERTISWYRTRSTARPT